MTQHHSTHEGSVGHTAHAKHVPHVNYKKIYVILLVLLAISIAGPHFGIKWLTLITAFGIAIVKANMVVQNFMHLRWEQKIMKWVLLSSVVIVALFWAAVRPDVGNHEGRNWTNDAARAAVERGIPEPHEEGAEGTQNAPRHAAAAPGGAHEAAAPAGGDGDATGFDAARFFTQNCSSCHGATGAGDGGMAAALNPKPANFTSAAFWSGKTDDELMKAIHDGGASVGRSAMMPAWGGLLNMAKTRAMVDYLKTLRR